MLITYGCIGFCVISVHRKQRLSVVKKLINTAQHVVREMLEGSVDFSPHQALLADENVVIRAALPAPSERPVAVLSGGGSGHEPAHAGYVGPGLLTAAVAGD